MSGDRGSVTLWMVGLVMVVFLVGGIAIDLWRGLTAHRHLASVVDAAAVAAGSGIDEERWRMEGRLVLDPERVGERVAVAVASQPSSATVEMEVVTAADGGQATVTGRTAIDLTLLALVTEGDLVLSASATASPNLSP